MKKLFFNLILISNLCFSQTTDWVKSFGGPDSDKGISIGCGQSWGRVCRIWRAGSVVGGGK